MKNNKFNVIWLDAEGNVHKEQQYKSFKEIEEELGLDYHVVREINKISDNKITKKFLHDNLKELSKKVRINTIIKSIKI
jgi:hypothetical protein